MPQHVFKSHEYKSGEFKVRTSPLQEHCSSTGPEHGGTFPAVQLGDVKTGSQERIKGRRAHCGEARTIWGFSVWDNVGNHLTVEKLGPSWGLLEARH